MAICAPSIAGDANAADTQVSHVSGSHKVHGIIFFAPSAFTPNGDQINDVWQPSALGVTEYHIDIYNHWGQVIWWTDDPVQPWLGEVQGGSHFVQDGMYTWRVRYRDLVGFRRAETGTVQIIR